MATAAVSLCPPPKFSKYEKMYESTIMFKGPEIDRIKNWVAMEKIHGANLSLTVWMEPTGCIEMKIARRNYFLTKEENFFGIGIQHDLLDSLHHSSERLWKSMGTPPESLTIYGELFGGYYPHPSIPPLPGIVSIQKEVAYCPNLKFHAYDIALCNGDRRDYMDYDKAMTLFGESGFDFCKPLCHGTFKEVTNFPLGFVSTLPRDFGLPPLDDNLAEGVVIKPLKNVTVETEKGTRRVIFKRKIEKFSERRALPRPQEHTAVMANSSRVPHYKGCEEIELLKYELFALVTEQRLINTLSKVGKPETKREWNEVKEYLIADIFETLREENEELWAECERNSIAMTTLTNEAKKQCGILISQYKKKL